MTRVKSETVATFILIAALIAWSLLPASDSSRVTPPGPPVPGEGKHLLIIEETAERGRLPQGQLSIVRSVDLRSWLSNRGWEFRCWDDDTDPQREAQWWQDAMQLERTSVPWLVLSNGESGVSEPLPEDVDAVKSLVEKYE